jgi:hypothetical protein
MQPVWRILAAARRHPIGRGIGTSGCGGMVDAPDLKAVTEYIPIFNFLYNQYVLELFSHIFS